MLLLFNGLAGSRLEKRMAVDEASTLNFAGFGTACPTPVTDVIFTEKAARQNSNRKWVEHEMAQFGIGLEPALSQLSQKHSNAPGCQVKVPALLPRSPFSFAPSSTIQHHPPDPVAERNVRKTTQVDSTKKSSQLSANHLPWRRIMRSTHVLVHSIS